MEKVVSTQLVRYLRDNNLFPDLQSAYRTHHSTETAILKVLSDILLALDSGDLGVLMLLDLSAAFDSVDHITLLHRLKTTYGLKGNVINWFSSYLKAAPSTSVHRGRVHCLLRCCMECLRDRSLDRYSLYCTQLIYCSSSSATSSIPMHTLTILRSTAFAFQLTPKFFRSESLCVSMTCRHGPRPTGFKSTPLRRKFFGVHRLVVNISFQPDRCELAVRQCFRCLLCAIWVSTSTLMSH